VLGGAVGGHVEDGSHACASAFDGASSSALAVHEGGRGRRSTCLEESSPISVSLAMRATAAPRRCLDWT
jgi:hypothetical protein